MKGFTTPIGRVTVANMGKGYFHRASFHSEIPHPFDGTSRPFQSVLGSTSSLQHVQFNRRNLQRKDQIQLFGTKRGTPGNPPGNISIYNEQKTLPNIDIQKLEETISIVRDILGYPTYDISLLLVDDDEMRDSNLESRGVNKPTDILSFPFDDCLVEPGILAEPEIDIPDYYNLGDMMVDVPYVMRRIEEDRSYHEGSGMKESEDVNEEDDEEEELYDDYVGDDDRGVSGAMEYVYDTEKRIQLLMVHGMLHLVGYDHIEDDDYEVMVEREEEVIKELYLRLSKINR